ncbi:hypothetical protein [Alteromonas sp. a30]|uniref:hypothetical protein n=1 Tax=Alteromonas sp. a30 TaxID=2730917 RepID=UPI00227F9FA5|nr:hypothetical protein [Alteromonas sp. a30]MCY7296434.1 hypothetical protein [Alteromonas sp. a30]
MARSITAENNYRDKAAHEFEFLYQPILDMETNQINAVQVSLVNSEASEIAITEHNETSFVHALLDSISLVKKLTNVQRHISLVIEANGCIVNQEAITEISHAISTYLKQLKMDANQVFWLINSQSSNAFIESSHQLSEHIGFNLLYGDVEIPKKEYLSEHKCFKTCAYDFKFDLQSENIPNISLAHSPDNISVFNINNLMKSLPKNQFDGEARILTSYKSGKRQDRRLFYYFPKMAFLESKELLSELRWIMGSISELIDILKQQRPVILIFASDHQSLPHLTQKLKSDFDSCIFIETIDELKSYAASADVLITLIDEFDLIEAMYRSLGQLPVIFLEDSTSQTHSYSKSIGKIASFDMFDLENSYQLFLSRLISKVGFKQELTASNSIALKSMEQASQYGAVVEYCKQLFKLETPDALMTSIGQFFDKQFGLKAAIMLIANEQRYYYFHEHEQCSPLVRKVLHIVHRKGRVYQYQDNRLVFNDDTISIIILNAPTDEEGLDKLRDLGATVVTIFGEKWKECRESLALSAVSNRIHSISTNISKFTQIMKEKQENSLNDFEKQIQDSFHSMDFTAAQEEFLLGLGKSMVKTLNFSHELKALEKLVLDAHQIIKQK